MANPLLRFVSSVCVQTAVYWGNPQSDGYGKNVYDTPIEIKCRWDDETKVLRDKKGKEVFSSARLLVTQDVEEDARIALTTLDSLSDAQKADPMLVDSCFNILRVTRTPLFRSSTEFVYEVYLWQTETG